MSLKTNRINLKVAVCGQYLGYERSNEGPLVVLHCILLFLEALAPSRESSLFFAIFISFVFTYENH